MTYDQARDTEQLRLIEPAIEQFIQRYNDWSGPAAGPRRTVFLFPGGLASKLLRAPEPFDPGAPPPDITRYETIWLDLDNLLEVGGGYLALNRTAPGVYEDRHRQIIVAAGTVEVEGISPYTGFETWAAGQFDHFVFGWDWRRPLDHIGAFFVQSFLPHFRQRVQAGCDGANPLADFALVGHSAGGMIVNWILRQSDPILLTMHKAVTVGTPFYGYAGQLHRWFEGDKFFNGPGGVAREECIRTLCTLPACYAWNFMDHETYVDNKAAFASDPEFPLHAYPCTDSGPPAGSVIADPYDPQPHPANSTTLSRYRTDINFDHEVELKNARALVKALAGPLTADQAERFFNIRGVQLSGLSGVVETLSGLVPLPPFLSSRLEGTPTHDTVGSATWTCVPPLAPSPVMNGPGVPGDGTQPAWTARHLGLAASHPSHVITVRGLDAVHEFMMSSPSTLKALASVL